MAKKPSVEELKARTCFQSFTLEHLIRQGTQLSRSFVLHVGPTNSGKTYESLKSLRTARTGVYLGPLRLLALEVFDTLNADGIPCSLLTGEEQELVPGAGLTASTVEMADFEQPCDVAVIDECQMLQDRERGAVWLRTILTLPAQEIHLCTAPEARYLLTRLIDAMGSELRVVEHHRLAPLTYGGMLDNIRNAQPGDALIAFSRKGVLGIAAELEQHGIQASVIYGALPPQSRREEVRRFREGETTVVVATDAIGMGISLPIRRVIFCQTEKYDGTCNRALNTAEILQIGGRAGRFGLYDEGQVLTMSAPALVQSALQHSVPAITQVVLPFPLEVLRSGIPLDILLETWNRMKGSDLWTRADMSVPLALFQRLRLCIPRDASLQDIYSLITCPVDPENRTLLEYWVRCCLAIFHREPVPAPEMSEATLEACELKYRALDIQHQMARRGGEEIDNLREKEAVSSRINAFLKAEKVGFLRRCSRCGRILPASFSYGMCEACHEKMFARHCSICGCRLPDWWPYGRCDSCHAEQSRHFYDWSETDFEEDEDEYEEDDE